VIFPGQYPPKIQIHFLNTHTEGSQEICHEVPGIVGLSRTRRYSIRTLFPFEIAEFGACFSLTQEFCSAAGSSRCNPTNSELGAFCQTCIRNMPFVVSLLLATLLALHQAQSFAFSDRQIQPGVYPAPALPHNFTKEPEYWHYPKAAHKAPENLSSYHGTSFSSQFGKTRQHKIQTRQSETAWTGWSNIHYMFTL